MEVTDIPYPPIPKDSLFSSSERSSVPKRAAAKKGSRKESSAPACESSSASEIYLRRWVATREIASSDPSPMSPLPSPSVPVPVPVPVPMPVLVRVIVSVYPSPKRALRNKDEPQQRSTPWLMTAMRSASRSASSM